MVTTVRWRQDTAANWTSNNPTLAAGEPGFESNTGYYKVGDGTTAWTSLAYANNYTIPAGTIVGTTDTQTISNKTFSGAALVSVLGTGYQNMVVLTSGSSATWTVPTALRASGAPFKVTMLGGGGQGGASYNVTAGNVGGGGGSGGALILYLTYVTGQTTATYTIGAGGTTGTSTSNGQAGSSTTFIYNGTTYTAGGGGGGTTASGGGANGAGGTATGGTINIVGNPGGYGGNNVSNNQMQAIGGSSPLGLGQGGFQTPGTGGASAGTAGTGYGSGGGGGYSGTSTTNVVGGAGASGIIIIEY